MSEVSVMITLTNIDTLILLIFLGLGERALRPPTPSLARVQPQTPRLRCEQSKALSNSETQLRCGVRADRASAPHAVGTWFDYGQCRCDQSLIIGTG